MSPRTHTRASKHLSRLRTPLLVLAQVRAVLGVVAIPLAPFLYREHYLILVLLRPTKEVLLAGGFLVRQHKLNLVHLVAAAVPLAIIGVWHFYYLGRAYAKEIQTGKGVPKWAGRLLPTDKIKKLCGVLDRKGERIVVIGRLASFPSSLLAAAAGASEMHSPAFLRADGVGGLLSIAEVIGAGYFLGESYRRAGPWITGVGVVFLVAALVIAGRAIVRE